MSGQRRWIAWGLWWLAGAAAAQVPATTEEAAFLRATILSHRLDSLYHPGFSGYDDELATLYGVSLPPPPPPTPEPTGEATAGTAPANLPTAVAEPVAMPEPVPEPSVPPGPPVLHWLDGAGRPLPFCQQLLDGLAQAEARGLRGRDYDLAWLRDALARAEAAPPAPGLERARLDFVLTLALLRYVSDLHIGRVDPTRVGIKIDVEPKKYDLAHEVGSALDEGDVAGLIRRAEPTSPLYHRLIGALARYRELAATVQEPEFVFPDKIKPGDPLAQASELFQYLQAIGDAEGLVAPTENVLSGDLETALKRFQLRHGLKPDAIIGPGTASALRTPLDYRVRQIELTLERLRWLPEFEDGPLIAVNIPEFRLWVFDKGEEPAFSMAVVVGVGLNKQTPVFLKHMRSVVLSPYWNVPYSITRKEYLPKLAYDASYLERNDYELVGPGGDEGATDDNLRALRAGTLRMRQKPGPHNALGNIKFDFPNDDAVYLHSTPQKNLFGRERRALSHGCVRVEDPIRLAQFVLADQPTWTAERIEEGMNRRTPLTVPLSRHIPVLLFYATATVGSDGRVAFFEDLYGHDRRLDKAMSQGH